MEYLRLNAIMVAIFCYFEREIAKFSKLKEMIPLTLK